MLGFRTVTQCPYCDAPSTTVVFQGRKISAIRHSTIEADLKCDAVREETARDVAEGVVVLSVLRKPRLTMDYLAIAKCAADGAYVRRKARDEAIQAAFCDADCPARVR